MTRLSRALSTWLGLLLTHTLWNAARWRRLPRGTRGAARAPHVAVLVPARDEERNIARCVHSLLRQDYPSYTVVALDDGSTDRTLEILHTLEAQHPRLRVLHGEPPPPGWVGKAWACHQLSQAAQDADLLVFVDADTWHRPDLLAALVRAMDEEGLDLLSVLPRQHVGSLGEALVVPLAVWSLMAHYPLAWPVRWRPTFLAAAVGQVLAVRKDTYHAAGGHAAVRGEVAEDLALARVVARRGGRWALLDGGGVSDCRMYHSGVQALRGFGKNLWSVFGSRGWGGAAAWSWVTLVLLWPYSTLLRRRGPRGRDLWPLAALLASWTAALVRARFPLWTLVLVPVLPLSAVLTGLYASWLRLSRKARWKGRSVFP